MTLSINNSSSSIGLTRSIGQSWGRLQTHMSHMSSGLRINSAAEGPAALVISEHLRSQIGSLQQEIENTSHLISKYQSADSTLSMARSQLNEIKELAISASNEAFYDDEAIGALESSAQYLESSYNRMVSSAELQRQGVVHRRGRLRR